MTLTAYFWKFIVKVVIKNIIALLLLVKMFIIIIWKGNLFLTFSTFKGHKLAQHINITGMEVGDLTHKIKLLCHYGSFSCHTSWLCGYIRHWDVFEIIREFISFKVKIILKTQWNLSKTCFVNTVAKFYNIYWQSYNSKSSWEVGVYIQ